MNISKSDVSVITTVYSGTSVEEFSACLASLNSQTIAPDIIFIVIDGLVPKNLSEFIETFESNIPIKVLKILTNQGPGYARNFALKSVETRFVAIMDSDDICVEDRIESQLMIFSEDNSLDVVGGKISEFLNNNPDACFDYERKIFFEHFDIFSNRLKVIPVNNVTAMVRVSSLKAVGGYPNLRFGEDYVLWLTMLSKGYKFANINKILVKVRIGSDFHSRRSGLKIFLRELEYLSTLRKRNLISRISFFTSCIKSLLVRFLPEGLYKLARQWFNK